MAEKPAAPPAQAPVSGVSPGGEVRNLGAPMSVTAGQEVQDRGQQQQVVAEKPQTPSEIAAAELAAAKASKDKPPPASPATPHPAATEEEAPDPRFEPYTKELTENGKLSPESIKAAAKQFGVSEKVVQAYVDAQAANLAVNNDPATIALHSAQVSAVQEQAGGDKAWNEYREWAATNDQASLKLIRDAVGGNSPEISKLVVKAAMDKAKAQGFGAPRDATNNTQGAPQSGGVQGFASAAEQNTAVNDPRYRRDPAYREGVNKRMQVSSF